MNQQDKLLELLKKQKEAKDMRTAMGLVDNFTRKVKMVEGVQGEPGHTPTKEELLSLIEPVVDNLPIVVELEII